MKNIFTLIFAFLISFFTFKTNAQVKNNSLATSIGVAVNLGAATNDPYKYAVGAEITLQKSLKIGIPLTFSIGYESFSIKDEFEPFAVGYDAVPVKAGTKIFLDNNFYALGEAGAAFQTSPGNYGTKFIYAAGVGAQLNKGFDISLRYEGLKVSELAEFENRFDGNLGQIALKIAYRYNLSK